jgi:hypothetical protein
MEGRTEVPISSDMPSSQEIGISIVRICWHGWHDCYLLSNGSVEAIVVPAIGRVMQLRLAGDSAGTLWENRTLDGRLHQAGQHQWCNFGGDKCWPAPQSAWPLHLGRAWPPPIAFDSLPAEAIVKRNAVILRSPVDSTIGIQVVRHVELDPLRPIMHIRTEFQKVLGSPVTVSIWTITQMQEPERICALLPAKSKFDRGYTPLLSAEPAGLKIQDRLLSLIRHPRAYVKIGADAGSLAWVGRNCVVRIDAEVEPGEYPDGGCITQIYTNPDPLHYVELETLGPLATMLVGDRIERTTVYAVTPRTTPDPEAEAMKIF